MTKDQLFVALGEARAVYSDHEDVVESLRVLTDRETHIAGVQRIVVEMAGAIGIAVPSNVVLGWDSACQD